ncbi:hypothetical protein B0H14DRAFT_2726447, partial [Mycena olivaceomarginata]
MTGTTPARPINFLSLLHPAFFVARIVKSADQLPPPEAQGPEERARIVDAIFARGGEMMMHQVQQQGRSVLSRSRKVG